MIDTTLPTGATAQARDSGARARERGNVVSVTVLKVVRWAEGVSTGLRRWLDDGGGDRNILRSTRAQFPSVRRARQHPVDRERSTHWLPGFDARFAVV